MTVTRTYACGCKAVLAPSGNPELDYCPKHAAAPDMYEALKEAQEMVTTIAQLNHIIDQNGDYEILQRHIAAALAKAEGK